MAEEEKVVLYIELYDNPLTEVEGDFSAKPRLTGSLTNSMVAARIVKQRSEYRLETIVNILDIADQIKAEALGEGRSVIDLLGEYFLSIVGNFNGEQDSYDPKRHTLVVNFKMGKYLRELLQKVEVRVIGAATVGPVINDVLDVTTQTLHTTLTPGSILNIDGENIRIFGSSEENGVYFVPVGGGEPVKATVIAKNNPSELIVQIPALEDGQYYVRVTTQFTNGKQEVKVPRSYDYPHPVQVGEGGNDDEQDGPVVQ